MVSQWATRVALQELTRNIRAGRSNRSHSSDSDGIFENTKSSRNLLIILFRSSTESSFYISTPKVCVFRLAYLSHSNLGEESAFNVLIYKFLSPQLEIGNKSSAEISSVQERNGNRWVLGYENVERGGWGGRKNVGCKQVECHGAIMIDDATSPSDIWWSPHAKSLNVDQNSTAHS